MTEPSAPAGWYPNPEDPGQQRYWDGTQWTTHTAPAAAGRAPVAVSQAPAEVPAAVAPAVGFDPYAPNFNVGALTEAQRDSYEQQRLSEFPTWAWVLLTIITFGIFGTIYHGLKHDKLPKIKHDDFGAGKGIGFLFIPFFNLYWSFVFWLRLTDRLNLQYRIRGVPNPVSRDLVLWTLILALVGWFILITLPVAWVMALIAGGQMQSAANALARGEVGEQPAPGVAGYMSPAAPSG